MKKKSEEFRHDLEVGGNLKEDSRMRLKSRENKITSSLKNDYNLISQILKWFTSRNHENWNKLESPLISVPFPAATVPNLHHVQVNQSKLRKKAFELRCFQIFLFFHSPLFVRSFVALFIVRCIEKKNSWVSFKIFHEFHFCLVHLKPLKHGGSWFLLCFSFSWFLFGKILFYVREKA